MTFIICPPILAFSISLSPTVPTKATDFEKSNWKLLQHSKQKDGKRFFVQSHFLSSQASRLFDQFLGLEILSEVQDLPGGQAEQAAHGENGEV